MLEIVTEATEVSECFAVGSESEIIQNAEWEYVLEFDSATNKDSSPLMSAKMAELPLFDNFA
jgi:hypothetical protein